VVSCERPLNGNKFSGVAGTTWRLEIKAAWELGGANGTEQVTVLSVDTATDTLVLMRECSAEGFFGEGEPTTRLLTRGEHTESVPVSTRY
jgi:hypothetical protein